MPLSHQQEEYLNWREWCKKPRISENGIHFRNATLELLPDGKVKERNFRSAQLNNTEAEFDNLALSMEQDGQAMSDVSSFHTDSLYTQHDSVQLSGTSQVTAEVVSLVTW